MRSSRTLVKFWFCTAWTRPLTTMYCINLSFLHLAFSFPSVFFEIMTLNMVSLPPAQPPRQTFLTWSIAQAEGKGAVAKQVESSIPALTSATQQAHGISVAHGSFVQAGGNVNLHTHYHGVPQQPIAILEALRLVPNLRKIHLDVLSKATPGTAIWIFKTDYWFLWLDPNGSLQILWGTGIRR